MKRYGIIAKSSIIERVIYEDELDLDDIRSKGTRVVELPDRFRDDVLLAGNRSWGPNYELITKKLEPDYITDIYDNYYFQNIKSVLECNLIDYKFLMPDEIHVHEGYKGQSVEEVFSTLGRGIIPNGYFSDKPLGLYEDINRNGMYWPFICCETQCGKIVMEQGHHRHKVLRDLGCSKKFLSLIQKVPRLDHNLPRLEQFVKCYILHPNNYSINETMYGADRFKQRAWDFLRIDEYILEFKSNDQSVVISNLEYFGAVLGQMIFNTSDRNVIKASPYINDEKIFKEWIDRSK